MVALDPTEVMDLLAQLLAVQYVLTALAATIDDPYSMGIFETITNVHFGGLAVEFFDGAT